MVWNEIELMKQFVKRYPGGAWFKTIFMYAYSCYLSLQHRDISYLVIPLSQSAS